MDILPSLHGVVAVVRSNSTSEALVIARGLVRTPVSAIEISLTVPDALTVIREVLNHERTRPIGAGSILTPRQVDEAAEAGVTFIVSPIAKREIVERAQLYDIAVILSGATPSEVLAAHGMGASAVGVFLVSSLGGVNYLRSLREALPHIPLVASGGISVGDVPSFLRAGCLAVFLDTAIIDRRAARRGDEDAVAAFAGDRLSRALADSSNSSSTASASGSSM